MIDEGDEDDDLRGRVVIARPQLDTTLRDVMRSNAMRALFGKAETVCIGRYELVREIGTGGGGSVFLARDPELRRDVAVKLVVAPDRTLRERALAEGQALARLAHPNVVSVFDVGVAGDRVYLVMELVRGDSLRVLAGRAKPRDVLRAYRQAGEGLVAAHEAGLVHGDFKPDNAVIEGDRVRIVDFGLAGALGEASLGGTTGYLAPEARGGTATPAIDQYAFAVSLGEGITRAAGSLPGWLEPIVKRGTHRDPAQRFPSMRVLLRALARDPRTRWTRRAVIVTPLVLAAAGYAIGSRGESTPACDDGAAMLAPAWTAERERAAFDHVLGLGTPFAKATAPRVRATVASYAQRWIAGRNAACVAARSEPSPAVIDRRSVCLATARQRLASTIDVFSMSDADGLSDAMIALSELPDLDRCADAEALRSDVAPPPADPRVAKIREAIDRAQVLADAARPDAVPAAAAAVADARALGYKPLLAASLLLHGRALLALSQRKAAIAPLTEAVDLAIVERDDRVAVEAFARAMLAKDGPSTPALILAELRPILVLAQRLGPRDRFAVALLHNHAGVLQLADGHPELARAEQMTALELARTVSGPGAVDLAWVRSNLALGTDDPVERTKLNDEAVAVARAHLGADHPMSLKLAIRAAFALPDRTAARTAARTAFSRLVELHPNQKLAFVDYGYELAILDLGDGDREAARAAFATVLAAASDPDSERIALSRAYCQILDGNPGAARDDLARLAKPPAQDAPSYTFLFPADAELARALAGDASAAARAIGYLERSGMTRLPVVSQRLAWAKSLTARSGSAAAAEPTSP
jgi:hypothetical protein